MGETRAHTSTQSRTHDVSKHTSERNAMPIKIKTTTILAVLNLVALFLHQGAYAQGCSDVTRQLNELKQKTAALALKEEELRTREYVWDHHHHGDDDDKNDRRAMHRKLLESEGVDDLDWPRLNPAPSQVGQNPELQNLESNERQLVIEDRALQMRMQG